MTLHRRKPPHLELYAPAVLPPAPIGRQWNSDHPVRRYTDLRTSAHSLRDLSSNLEHGEWTMSGEWRDYICRCGCCEGGRKRQKQDTIGCLPIHAQWNSAAAIRVWHLDAPTRRQFVRRPRHGASLPFNTRQGASSYRRLRVKRSGVFSVPLYVSASGWIRM
jgi:hypothetical protein